MKKRIIIVSSILGILSLATIAYFKIRTISIKFVYNNDSSVASVTEEYKPNSKVTLPAIENEGYLLDGWYLGDEKIEDQTLFSKSSILEAKWLKIYNITLKNGEEEEVLEYVENSKLELPKLEKDDYKFLGWMDDTNKIVDSEYKIISDLTLIPKWGELEDEE